MLKTIFNDYADVYAIHCNKVQSTKYTKNEKTAIVSMYASLLLEVQIESE